MSAMNSTLLSAAFFLASASAAPAPLFAQEVGLEGDALRKALNDTAEDFWFYDDLPGAMKKAQASGKPLLVSFRCVP